MGERAFEIKLHSKVLAHLFYSFVILAYLEDDQYKYFSLTNYDSSTSVSIAHHERGERGEKGDPGSVTFLSLFPSLFLFLFFHT